MSHFLDKIDKLNLPKHVAVIMDGNGRWAKSQNRPRIFGHKNGVKAVRAVSEAAAELGVEFLTLYAFSTENWKRPALEVNALMTLLVETVRKELKTLHNNNIRLNAIGDISKLPNATKLALLEGIKETDQNSRMTLTLALNYSSRWEITEAIKSIASKIENGGLNIEEIDESTVTKHLNTFNIPDPELLIRTSGEKRISNFLLWQLAYTEFYFTDVFWPEFKKETFYEAIVNFQQRERRFGKTGEQVKS